MKIEILDDVPAVAARAAAIISQYARDCVTVRGACTLAVSGGRTPWQMLRALVDEEVPWRHLEIFQVDERIAPAGDSDRNLTHLHASLLEYAPLQTNQIHAMPVNASDPAAASAEYIRELQNRCGAPPILDLVHLGLGPDGHTASLVPNDPVLEVRDADVALTGVYQGRRRMTLTYPILNRARQILWLVTGSDKCGPLRQLCNHDASIPAGRVNAAHASVLADRAAAAKL